MIFHHFKLVWRHLVKDRQFTLLNLLGLSSGLACAFLIYLWVADECHMDKYHEHDAHLFQVFSNARNSDGISTIPATNALLARTLKTTMPEVEDAAAVLPPEWFGKITFSHGNNATRASGIFADLAMRLFHTNKTENLVGKTVEWEHEKTYIISGIFDDVPANSSVRFEYVLPMENFLETHAGRLPDS